MTPMQPLGAPGTPASPQALPYNAFPAPRIGQASAGSPATPIAPLIQSTQTQINDALSAARGPQPAPQLAAQPPQQRPGMGQGALGMMAGMMGHNQQPSPWGSMFSGQPQSPQQQSPFGGMFQPGRDGAGMDNGMGMFGMIPPQLRELLGGNQQQRFWGGFNWGGQQGNEQDPASGRTPYTQYGNKPMFPGAGVNYNRDRGGPGQPMGGPGQPMGGPDRNGYNGYVEGQAW